MTRAQPTLTAPILTENEAAAIVRPIETARTLPRRAFTDPAFFEFECAGLLANHWLAVAFSAQVPPSGALPLDILGQPLLLVRNAAGVLHVFHNVCPYDGTPVVDRATDDLAEIETPYHGLVYSLEGRLIRAAYWDGTPSAAGVDLGVLALDLAPVPCSEWMETIFVNPDGTAGPFAVQNEPVEHYFADIRLEDLAIHRGLDGGPRFHSLDCAANWKTMYENFSPNVYHENYVHHMYRQSAHVPRVDTEGRRTYDEVLDDSGMIGLAYDNRIAGSYYGDPVLPPVRCRDGRVNPVNHILNVYPNWAIIVTGYFARIAFMLPDGPGACRQSIATYFDRAIAAAPESFAHREASAKAGFIARIEDNAICESVQRARRSPACDTLPYNPFWDRPHHLLTQVFLRKYRAAGMAI
ncbi:MAG: aromatic ring-hydroxylating dioxygenase subunit alpha [Zavarzinia sp.]|nr:aromatic ring-hydroxylating dioxygenase subunit alpha [Zavarzinia sp.]